jgi:hypothetical protein
LLEGKALTTAGEQRLVNAQLWTALKCTDAGIVEKLKAFPI